MTLADLRDALQRLQRCHVPCNAQDGTVGQRGRPQALSCLEYDWLLGHEGLARAMSEAHSISARQHAPASRRRTKSLKTSI
jgi:hypothetical protein